MGQHRLIRGDRNEGNELSFRVRPWGSFFIAGSLKSSFPICSPTIWSLSTDLSLKNYSFATKAVSYMRECVKFKSRFSL